MRLSGNTELHDAAVDTSFVFLSPLSSVDLPTQVLSCMQQFCVATSEFSEPSDVSVALQKFIGH